MREIDPKETTRAYAFEMWMDAPMPMVTFFKTLDITRLTRLSRRSGMKFNMLMCWCIGKAASGIKEFYMLPVGRRLMQYDSIAVNTIVANRSGEVSSCDIPFSDDLERFGEDYLRLTRVSSCDIPFSDDLERFGEDYLRLTRQVAESCRNHDLTESMVIGTSALAQYEIDGAVGTVSFQFHHTQMDGAHASRFLDSLQKEINDCSRRKTYPKSISGNDIRKIP